MNAKDAAKCLAFAASIFREHRGDGPDMIGDVDGWWLQQEAERCGLLERVAVTGSCGADCTCGNDDDHDYCYRLTSAGLALLNRVP